MVGGTKGRTAEVKHGGCGSCGSTAHPVLTSTSNRHVIARLEAHFDRKLFVQATGLAVCPDCIAIATKGGGLP